MYIVYWLTNNLNFLTLNVNLFIYYDCLKVKKNLLTLLFVSVYKIRIK